MSTNPYPIVLAADASYALPLAVTLRSIVEAERDRWPLEFYLLHDGFSEELQKKVANSLPCDGPGFEDSAILHWVPVALDLFSSFPYNPHNTYLTKMAYGRLLIPKIIPENVSRVLYLDTDVLVLDNLAPLWRMDLEGNVLGAILDFNDGTNGDFDSQSGQSEHSLYYGLPRVKDCFNSGVLLIDLDRWRQEGISEEAFAYLSQYPKTPKMDQDALNIACDGNWKQLDPWWNVQDHLGRRFTKGEAGILHFSRRIKPWLPRMRSRNVGLYDSFRSRTLFARTPLDKLRDTLVSLEAGVRNVVKRKLSK
jgi:lipopolysaccharide biosynthesis glycosyltransferase